jgi:DNA-binding XRE family transcriptional regulator
MSNPEFNELIRTKRKEKNITQEKLAEILDISTVTMSGIERGEVELKIDTCLKAAKALDIPINEIFDKTDENKNFRRKSKRRIIRLVVAIIIVLLLNAGVDAVYEWDRNVRVHNFMICTAVGLEDNILSFKNRNPETVSEAYVVYRVKLDEKMQEEYQEQYGDIKMGDVILINYYFRFSQKWINLSYNIREIEPM